MERKADIYRKTKETEIQLMLDLDGLGNYKIITGIGFFDHMLEQVAKHGHFDLTVTCKGDLEVDAHHTVEDVGIVFGQALKEALAEKRGIKRYAHILLPMDECLTRLALDISGRAFLYWDVNLPASKLGTLETECIKEFFLALTRTAELCLHIEILHGENTHHIIEGVFKALAKVLHEATRIDNAYKDLLPSTKGVL